MAARGRTTSSPTSRAGSSALIAELMGIPRADGERLYELTEIMHTTDEALAPRRRSAAIAEMLGYAQSVAEHKRTNPGNDIASARAGRGRRRSPDRRRAPVVLPPAGERRR
ncbi:MAG: hypothetical protein R2715_02525 [Ilumatobacteraceae bacterium]